MTSRLGPARGRVRARRRGGRRERRARRRAPDAGRGAARARPRRRHLGFAQPARIQRRQVLRPARQQAHRRVRGGDRGAARRFERGGGSVDRVGIYTDSFSHVVERFGTDLSGLRIAVDCANGAYAEVAPDAFARLGAAAIGDAPNGENINEGCGATDLALLQRTVREAGLDLGVAFDGDGDRMLAVDADGNAVDGDQILAILALHLNVDVVAVTVMTNLGYRLMQQRGVRVVTTRSATATCSRRSGARTGSSAVSSPGHVICLRDHVTGDGSPRRSCSATRSAAGRSPGGRRDAALRAGEVDVRVSRREVPEAALAEAERLRGARRERARPRARVGYEPLIEVLGEAETRK